jgi:hypothetical protein
MQPIVHSTEAILELLRRGLAPLTDNRDAVVVLGFDRAYPQIRAGYKSMIWERVVERRHRPDGRLSYAKERVYLVAPGVP